MFITTTKNTYNTKQYNGIDPTQQRERVACTEEGSAHDFRKRSPNKKYASSCKELVQIGFIKYILIYSWNNSFLKKCFFILLKCLWNCLLNKL